MDMPDLSEGIRVITVEKLPKTWMNISVCKKKRHRTILIC